jgi:MerR family transcriptional regulator, light-induced transcriptional regulator
VRSAGGFRLYAEADAWRIRQMQAHRPGGLSAAGAARTVLAGSAGPGKAAGALREALDDFDEPAAQAVLDRLAGLARGWGDGHGPRALLACPPGEMHDVALMIFGIALNRVGWRIDYFGADAPVEELTRAVHTRPPELVVLAATRPQVLEPLTGQLSALAGAAPLLLAGAGATPELAAAVGARLPDGDPVTAASAIGRLR